MARALVGATCALLALPASGFRMRKQRGTTPVELDDDFAWAAEEDRADCRAFMALCKQGNQTYCEIACTRTIEPAYTAFEGTLDDLGAPMTTGPTPIPTPTPTLPLGDLVALGQLLWDIIKDSRPISDITNKHVSVIEKDTQWTQYSGWSRVESGRHRVVEARNVLGGTVISVDMKMDFFAHGGLDGHGNGLYLKNCYAAPSVDVTFGNYVEGRASAGTPVNMGSTSNPCALIDVIFSFNFGSFIKSWNQDWRFTFRCDGYWRMFPL